MATRIKGITIELDGNTTKLEKALKGVNDSIKTTQSNLRDVEKMLKFDPTNTELLAQKQTLLRDRVSETAEKLELLKKAEKQLQEQVKNGTATQEQYDALEREIMATESALKKATTEADKFNVSVEKMKGHLTKASSALSTAADKTKGFSTAAAGVVAGLAGMAVKSAKTADEISTLSKQTGLSTDTLQEMAYASELVDVDVTTIRSSLTRLIRSMSDAKTGTGNAAETFEKLGVQVTNANGDLRDSEDVFYDVLEALSTVGNETERDADAMEIFGRSAQELNPIIEDGGEYLKQLGQEAHDAGLILSEEALQGANDFNDSIDKLKATFNATVTSVGADVADVLQPVIEGIGEMVADVLAWIRDLGADNILTILKIATIIAAISPVLDLLSKISAGMTVILSHPLIAGAAAVVAVIAGIGLLIADAQGQMTEAEIANKELKGSIDKTNDSIATNADLLKQTHDAQVDRNKIVLAQAESYNALTDATWEEIEAMKAEAVLKANYDNYEAALKRQVDLSNDLRDAQRNYNSVTDGLNATLARRSQVEAQLRVLQTQAIVEGSEEAVMYYNLTAELEELSSQEAFYGSQLQSVTAGLQTARENYNANMSTISSYELVQQALQEGTNNLEEAILALSYGLRTAADADEATLQEQLAYYEETYADMLYAVENNGAKISQAQFDEIQNLIDITKTELKKVNDEFVGVTEDWASPFYGIGQDIGSGLASGIRSMLPEVGLAADSMAEKAEQATRKRLLIHSPSRVMENLGSYTSEGFAEGILSNLGMVDSAMTRLTGVNADVTTGTGAQVMAGGTGSAPVIIHLTQPVYLGGQTIGNAITETVVENITANQNLQAAYVGV